MATNPMMLWGNVCLLSIGNLRVGEANEAAIVKWNYFCATFGTEIDPELNDKI